MGKKQFQNEHERSLWVDLAVELYNAFYNTMKEALIDLCMPSEEVISCEEQACGTICNLSRIKP